MAVVRFENPKRESKMNWVFVTKLRLTSSDFLIPISLYFNVGDLRYFQLWIIFDRIGIVWNRKGFTIRLQRYRDCKIRICGKNSVPLNFYFQTLVLAVSRNTLSRLEFLLALSSVEIGWILLGWSALARGVSIIERDHMVAKQYWSIYHMICTR